MKSRYLISALLLTALVSAALAQDCPKWDDKAAALKFLQENKSRGTELDPHCVDRAFATLHYDKSYIPALIELLDFERSVKFEISLITTGRQYPAVEALELLGQPSVPYAIKVIKENESELIRTNATWALQGILYQKCLRDVIKLLEVEAQKQATTAEQQQRLRAAEELIRKLHHLCEAEGPLQ